MSKKTTKAKNSLDDIRSHLLPSERTLRSRSVSPSGNQIDKMDTTKLTEDIFAKLCVMMDAKFGVNETSLGDKIDEKFNEMTENMNTSLDECTEKWESKVDDKFNEKFAEIKELVSQNDEQIRIVTESVFTLNQNYDELLEKQKQFIEEMRNSEIRCMKLEQSIKELSEKEVTLTNSIAFMNEEVDTLKAEMEELRCTKELCQKLEKKVQNLEDRDEASEQHMRNMNLWFYGLEQTVENEDSWEVVKDFCVKILNVERESFGECVIRNAHRVGKKGEANRPLIVAFVSWKDRMRVLKAAGGLYKYNTENNTKFGVKTDLAPKARAERKKYQIAKVNMTAETGNQGRVCNDTKGRVWLESRKPGIIKWDPVKVVEPRWFIQKSATQKK